MGAAPSRETHRRGIFTVSQSGSMGGMGSRKQDIVLIPLTREYFPSPDCPLFVQFHKARCDAAVNYYFRRPGDPGDLSTIPNYAGSARTMPEERMRRHRRRREAAAQRKKRAEEAEEERKVEGKVACDAMVQERPTNSDADQGLDEIEVCGSNDEANTNTRREESDQAKKNDTGAAMMEVAGDEGLVEEADEGESEDEDDSYPSREALYRGVIDHVEEVLFDTDAEMREAYAFACANPNATVGPTGQKLRKVLPVLCAVAFRMDASRLPSGAPEAFSPNTATTPSATPSPTTSSNQQIVLDNGILLHGNILNIVGCFGFVSMQDEVEAILQLQKERQGGIQSSPTSPMGLLGSTGRFGNRSPGGSYRHDPYTYASGQPINASSHPDSSSTSDAAAVPSGADAIADVAAKAAAGVSAAGLKQGTVDIVTLPQPIAAPLAALVFLTKSAGEQNLGRVTHIAATMYYYQLIQAGVIQRRGNAMGEMPPPPPPPPHYQAYPPPPLRQTYTPSGASPNLGPGTPNSSHHGGSRGFYSRGSYNPATYPPTSPLTSMPELFQPPIETFSFSSLLTNIPILSFLYEMKCRWGYLGVLKGGTPTANSSFANNSFTSSLSSFNLPAGRRPGTMMGNHSTGGLAAVDPYSGQDVTDEMEMWITPDHMIHGRISRALASRLCLSLAERPEVMQERVMQLPSEEDGYWRYRGLVGRSKPPPVPGPGRIVSINPKDVYVVGSDVLPGFDEGDILRFDPERMVWFADHSIPLEGVVLAAMRPYCKAAREADPTDPSWVTRLARQEEIDYLREVKGEEEFQAPAATPEQQVAMKEEPDLRVVHEHEGNFYVYQFERDGTTYYHGTIPNFANPNKRRSAAATLPGNASQSQHVQASSQAGPETGVGDVHVAGAGRSGTEKPTVQVPKTIASALFSLFPGSPKAPTTTEEDPANATTSAAPVTVKQTQGAANSTKAPTPQRPRPGGAPAAAVNASAPSPTAPPATVAPETEIPAYLRGRVTSTAIEAARKLVMNLYSYAYGTPMRNNPASPSPPGSRDARTPISSMNGGVQRSSYPPTSPHHAHQASTAATVSAAPTVAALNANSSSGIAGGGGGMYPRNYRPPSSAARSSTNSTPAGRHVNPNAVLPGRSPTSSNVNAHAHQQYPCSPVHQPCWPQSPTTVSPELSVGPGFTAPPPGPEAHSPTQMQHNPPNVHVRVGSRSLTHQPFDESGATTPYSNVGTSLPRQGSHGDLAASGSFSMPVTVQPVPLPQQQQVKRYKEGGNYVWDWRMGVSSGGATQDPPSPQ